MSDCRAIPLHAVLLQPSDGLPVRYGSNLVIVVVPLCCLILIKRLTSSAVMFYLDNGDDLGGGMGLNVKQPIVFLKIKILPSSRHTLNKNVKDK